MLRLRSRLGPRCGSVFCPIDERIFRPERALVAALDRGQLAGAALDVFDKEPPIGSPVLGRDNVILTPHTAFYSEESLLELQIKAAEEVERVLNGFAPKNAVNP